MYCTCEWRQDSWYQIIVAKELGLKVLAITWKTPARTEIGKKFEKHVKFLKVDHIDYFSLETEKKFLVAAYEKTGVLDHHAPRDFFHVQVWLLS